MPRLFSEIEMATGFVTIMYGVPHANRLKNNIGPSRHACVIGRHPPRTFVFATAVVVLADKSRCVRCSVGLLK